MLIRVEIPIDAPGIDALLRRSFESDAEAKLVHDLREDGFLTLGLVATDDEGQVIGYVAFSPGKLLIIPSIFFFSGFSFATTQPLVTIGELEAQQNRNILLQAKVQGAQLQKQLEESDVTSSSETVSGFSGVTASLPSVSEQPTSKNRKELPVIMEINGKDKRLNAVLRMADGRQTSVTTGSQLPGTSVTVKSISLSGVTLSDGTTLTF